MKQYGHTKTLFIEGWKYKWSRKYDHCQDCKTCDSKHKGNGICTRCTDKRRSYDPVYAEQKRQAKLRYHKRNYQYIPREEWKKFWPKNTLTPDERRAYQRDWMRRSRYIKSFLSTDQIPNFPQYKGYTIKLDFASGTAKEIEEKTKMFTILKEWIDKKTNRICSQKQ